MHLSPAAGRLQGACLCMVHGDLSARSKRSDAVLAHMPLPPSASLPAAQVSEASLMLGPRAGQMQGASPPAAAPACPPACLPRLCAALLPAVQRRRSPASCLLTHLT